MLLLKSQNVIVKEVLEHSQFTLPNGDVVSPAYEGWDNGTYSLEKKPDLVPTPITAEQRREELIANINTERDRRLAQPFSFRGNLYDRDEKSLARITGAATLAGFALLAGKEQTTQWITNNNTVVTLSAQEMLDLGTAAAIVEANIIFAARRLKDLATIPEDYTNDSYWVV